VALRYSENGVCSYESNGVVSFESGFSHSHSHASTSQMFGVMASLKCTTKSLQLTVDKVRLSHPSQEAGIEPALTEDSLR
jgi:hypothetical protein